MKQEEKAILARKRILEAAERLFAQKGFEAATMQDLIMESGLSKGAIYHYFNSKEEIIDTLIHEMFLENNPFETVKNRTDLSGLEKMKMAMTLNQSDQGRMDMSKQAIPILKNPRMLARMMEANRSLFTPFWLELIEEGIQDGSIYTQYARELSELIPLLDFWLASSIYPANAEQMYHKVLFLSEMLCHMGLPLLDDQIMNMIQKSLLCVE